MLKAYLLIQRWLIWFACCSCFQAKSVCWETNRPIILEVIVANRICHFSWMENSRYEILFPSDLSTSILEVTFAQIQWTNLHNPQRSMLFPLSSWWNGNFCTRLRASCTITMWKWEYYVSKLIPNFRCSENDIPIIIYFPLNVAIIYIGQICSLQLFQLSCNIWNQNICDNLKLYPNESETL